MNTDKPTFFLILYKNSHSNFSDMAHIIGVWGVKPQIGIDCVLADDCTLEGDVVLGNGCNIGSKVYIKGTAGPIILGNRVRISENTTISTLINKTCLIDDDVTIAKNSTIELSCIGARTQVECNATIKYAFVEQDSFVPQNSVINTGTWGGNPARFIKGDCPLTTVFSGEFQSKIAKNNLEWKRKDK